MIYLKKINLEVSKEDHSVEKAHEEHHWKIF